MNFNEMFDSFSNKLSMVDGFLSEDRVRYILFLSMYGQDSNVNHYNLELPYECDENNPLYGSDFSSLLPNRNYGELEQELDLYYTDEVNKYAVELKFHRKANSTMPKPQHAGSLFNDLRRLNLIRSNNFKRIFVYVTDDEMHNYFIGNGSNGCSVEPLRTFFYNFYSANAGGMIDDSMLNGVIEIPNRTSTIFKAASKSFIEEATPQTIRTNLKMLYRNDIDSPSVDASGGHLHIRVFEIL